MVLENCLYLNHFHNKINIKGVLQYCFWRGRTRSRSTMKMMICLPMFTKLKIKRFVSTAESIMFLTVTERLNNKSQNIDTEIYENDLNKDEFYFPFLSSF